MRKIISLIVLGSMLVVVGVAQASPPSVFKGAVKCSTQPDGIRFCGSLIVNKTPVPVRTLATSWDGTAVDVNFALPRASAHHHGPYPLVMLFHGYGGSKFGLGNGGGGIGSAISSMTPWLSGGYATFSMTDRGFHESCGNAASRHRRPDRLRQRLHPAARRPLRGPRRAVLRRRARRRGAGLPDQDRRDRRLLRRRHVDGARRPEEPHDAARRLADRPGRARSARRWRIAAAAPESRGPTSPTALTPNGSTLDYVANAPYQRRPRRRQEAVVRRRRSTRGRLLGTTRPARTDPDSAPTSPTGRPLERRRALRRQRRRDGDGLDEVTHQPLLLLHRRLGRARADADLQRLDRRPLPGRRGAPLLQPDQTPVPEHADLAVLHRLRPHPRARTRPPTPAAAGVARRERLVRLLRQGRRVRAGHAGRRDPDPDLPGLSGVRRPVPRPDWAQLAPGEIRLTSPGGADDRRRRRPRVGTPSTRSPAGACATASGADQRRHRHLPAAAGHGARLHADGRRRR